MAAPSHYFSQKFPFFSEEQLSIVQGYIIPSHVAIIMDGNRRWARKQILSKITNPFEGHWAGAQIISTLVEAALHLGIKVLTLYAFSTENWSRSPREVKTLLRIFETYLKRNRERMVEQGVHFDVIGDFSLFPQSLKKEIQLSMQATEHCSEISLVTALNYGGRDEICRAIRAIAKDVMAGKIKQEAISEGLVASYLDTSSYGDPDLLIRTSGEMRLSNFLLWQAAYTEVYVTDVLWPDFTPHDLFTAVVAFQKRKRRRGR